MGKTVNVVLWDGRVISMPEEDAAQLQNEVRPETPVEETARATEAQRAADVAGPVRTAEAGVEGALDTLSLGGYGKLVGAIAPDEAEKMRARGEEHSTARAIGEVAGMLVPGVGEAGLGARIGEGAKAVGGKLVGRAVEGAAYGVGGEIAHSNVSGDPLTIEGAAEGAGLGALFNLGAGALADRVRGLQNKAVAAKAEAEAVAKDVQVVQDRAKAFSDTPPSWNEFRDSYLGKQEATAKVNREIQREADDYAEFYNTHKLGRAADVTQDVINELKNERYAARGANVQYIEGKPRAAMTAYDTTGGETTARQVLVNSPPPVSDELAERFKDYQRRMSRVYKLESGGYSLDNTGKWVKDSAAPADPKRALEELRSIQTDLKAEFPKASHGLGKWGDLPAMPRDPLPNTDVDLPKSLREFARKRPEQIAEIAQSMDPASAQAFNRFTGDLGLTVYPDPAATVTGVHKTLGDYIQAVDRLRSKASELAAHEANKPLLLRMMNKAVRYGASRYFDVGGVLGGFTRAAGGEAVGRALTGLEDTALGGVVAASKDGIRARVRDLVAKYGNGGARAAEKLGPVTAYLQRALPSGEHDKETDVRKLAANRAADAVNLQLTAPDVAFTAIQPLLGQPSDIALKMHQQMVNAANHIAAVAPKDSGLNTTLFGSNWTPSWHQALELAHRLEAVLNPLAAVARALSGKSHPGAADTLWSVWPAIMQEISVEFSHQAQRIRPTYQRASAMSLLLRQPMSGLQQPQMIAAMQGIHLPQVQQTPGQPGSTARAPQPTGRPPAVQSPVAGSDVSSLISQ